MDAATIRRTFAPWILAHERTAWKPVPTETSDTPPTATRFGGTPSAADADWPRCAACQAPMAFFFQLDLASAPDGSELPGERGLVQLFYCVNDDASADGMCEHWDPWTGAHHTRLVAPSATLATPPPGVRAIPHVPIGGWETVADLPDPEDQADLGLDVDYDFDRKVATARCSNPPIVMEDVPLDIELAETLSSAAPGDKLGGWPHWIQGPERPACPTCSATMTVFFQIDSEDHLDFMFGDSGCGHLSFCPNHPEVMTFAWACC